MLSWGFYFVEFEMSCIDPQTGREGTQLVYGVRVPEEEDVSSEFILKQRTWYLRRGGVRLMQNFVGDVFEE
jgi:hypothetical protein